MNESKIRQNVANNATEKPLKFSITREVQEVVKVDVITKERYVRWLPIYKTTKAVEEKLETREVTEDFYIYHPTIGKFELLTSLVLQINIDYKRLDSNPHEEVNRICAEHTNEITRMMAIMTFKDKDDVMNDDLVSERAEFFKWHCTNNDLATCLLAMFSMMDYENFTISMRLTKILDLNKRIDERADHIENQQVEEPSTERS